MSQHKRLRRLAVLAAGAVASTSLVGFAGLAPAQADTTPAAGPTLTWSFSEYLATMFDGHATSGGAANVGTDVVFGGGEGTNNPTAGTFDMAYDGRADFSWHGVTISFSNPEVSVASGAGTITADVAWDVPAQGPNPAANGSADDVLLTRFATSGATWSDVSLAATPQWTGALPPNSSQAVALGMDPDEPVDGQSWAPEFLTVLPSNARAYFYASGSASDAKKAPAGFTAQAQALKVTATTTYASQSATIKVTGENFSGSDGNPGDDGVYVGLAPAGGLPSTSSMSDMDKFVAAQWVPASAIQNSQFSTTLTASADKLDKGTSYAIYTWRAHSHSSASQDTQSAITFDWSKLTAKAKVKAKVKKKPTTKKAGKLAVQVKGGSLTPTGKVKVTLKKGKATKKRNAKLANGKAVVKLPKLKPGKWKVKVAFASANDAYTKGATKLKLKVKKAKKSKK